MKSVSRFLLAVGIAITISCKPSSAIDHPFDESLIEQFQNQEGDFNLLLKMFIEDEGLFRLGDDFIRSSRRMSPVRIGEYRKLFKDLHLPNGIGGYEDKSVVWFNVSANGLSIGGSEKGFAYRTSKPELLVRNLDEYASLLRTQGGRSATAFRHIKGNWYLYFEFED